MRDKLVWLFAVIAAGFVVWVLWPDQVDAGMEPATEGSAPSGETRGRDLHAKEGQPLAAEEGFEAETRIEVPRDRGVGEATVVLKGRCVDYQGGRPLRGCEVKVHGWGANSSRMEEYLRTHDKVEWQDPPAQTTAADGHFEFCFVPPPPFQFTLRITMPARVMMRGRWHKLDPGNIKDFGDVPVEIGTHVTGIVLDTKGVPQGRVGFSLTGPRRSSQAEIGPRQYTYVYTGADGRFRLRNNLSPGSWHLRLSGRQLVSPDKVEISADQAATHLEIRVRSEADVPKITGVVVDEVGAPVRGARLDYTPTGFRGGQRQIDTSGKDGSFVVKRRPDDGDSPVRILVERSGYEHRKPTEPVAWGTTGLRLALKRGLTIDLTVNDGDTGKPIEKYGVICHLDVRSDGRWSSSDYRVRHHGTHPGGRLLIPGVLRGRNQLVVVPQDGGYAMSTIRMVDVQGVQPVALVVALYPPARRPVRVTTVNQQEAVVGTKLQLVERATDHPIDGETTLMKRVGRSISTSAPNRGWLAHETKTNTKGEAELIGQRNGVYALRLLGPGHLPVVVQDVVLDPSLGPLEVRVGLGATVRGRLRPPEVLGQFQPPERVINLYKEAGEQAERNLTRLYPGVNLGAKGRGVFPRGDGAGPGRVPLDKDSSFEISGIPPGTWALSLAYNEFSGGGWHTASLALETLHDLKDGEVRKVDLDISHLQKAKVEGRVFLNGEPLTNAQISLATFKGNGSGGRTPASSVSTKTDGEGRFTKRMLSGTYIIFCFKTVKGRIVQLQGEGELQVDVGEDVHRDFHIRTAALRIRLLAADGKTPLSGIKVRGSTVDGAHGFGFPRSDKNGHTQLPMMSVGVYELRIWPKRLAKPEVRNKLKLWQQGPGAVRRAQILLGTIRVQAGDSEPQDILVPAEAGY